MTHLRQGHLVAHVGDLILQNLTRKACRNLVSETISNIAVDVLTPECQCISFLKDKTPQTDYLSIHHLFSITF